MEGAINPLGIRHATHQASRQAFPPRMRAIFVKYGQAKVTAIIQTLFNRPAVGVVIVQYG